METMNFEYTDPSGEDLPPQQKETFERAVKIVGSLISLINEPPKDFDKDNVSLVIGSFLGGQTTPSQHTTLVAGAVSAIMIHLQKSEHSSFSSQTAAAYQFWLEALVDSIEEVIQGSRNPQDLPVIKSMQPSRLGSLLDAEIELR